MANVQLENGYTKIANKTLEQMAKIKLSATQYRIVMVVWRYTYGFNRKMHELAISFISEATGCSKRQIERELKDLVLRKILLQESQKGKTSLIGFNKDFDKWVSEKVATQSTTDKTDGSKQKETADESDGTQEQKTTDRLDGTDISDGGSTTDKTDGTPPSEQWEVLPSDQSDKKESITKKLKEINDDENACKEMTPQEVFQAIETKYIQRRARGTQTNAQDDQDIQQVIAYGIPLEDILRFIDERFDTYKPKHPRDRINSFGYVADYIFQRYHDEQQKRAALDNVVPLRKGERDGKHKGLSSQSKFANARSDW
ncbi:replication protein [Aneurinibacillus migulanus]|uniref:Phage replication protein O n=1 Tax=Aneurinibacillus migulanus TaxID=47500 RepID=A0A0D1XVM5_ANEMI|nr:replication protein [Aneurinibacillus migulanus]KIV56193.1 hypothetical protein TS65_13290 [Aneurinibacillus migulanus]KON84257.1 hypothetical protein AF333_30440 [Aneurinibacillus migulanus]MED0895264.1 replication protein [Aneurinibacillus migulanus]MED1616177.1 replication protein [Aneurinibacillus migulanus]SDI83265.1 phage replication protein O [Aneurinibacillus migulanus]